MLRTYRILYAYWRREVIAPSEKVRCKDVEEDLSQLA
jgi:hypothetical protein